MRLLPAQVLVAVVALVLGAAPATAATLTEYPLPNPASQPQGIVAGPDGALWFTETTGARIGRIALDGTISEYPLPTPTAPSDITAGPDGALWFTEPNVDKIGRIALDGTISEYPLAVRYSYPVGIAAGPDGALWFTEYQGDKIGRITVDGTIVEYPLPSAHVFARGIAAGPDGALWFTESEGHRIGRIALDGTITEYPLPGTDGRPVEIAAGPDEALWFTVIDSNRIGRIALDGTITEYPLPSADIRPIGIAAGPDQALWFSEPFFGNRLFRISLDGTVNEYPLPGSDRMPYGIAAGPDGAVWFTEFGANRIGRIATDVLDETPPVIAVPTEPPTVDATTPEGAIVEYVVTAYDDVDGTVPVTCTPASGSRFTIGETTVHCTAVDAAGNTATASFVVRVKSAGLQIVDLRADVLAANTTQGIVNSLDAKLEAVQEALAAANAGNRSDAGNKLDAFISHVEAQAGKQLTPAQADELIAAALRIKSVLGLD